MSEPRNRREARVWIREHWADMIYMADMGAVAELDNKFLNAVWSDECKKIAIKLTPRQRPLTSGVNQHGWRSMESAPRKGNLLLDIGETIPGTPNARVGKFISEAEAATFHETLSSAGGWMIWNADDDWFVVPFADAFGWMPLPTPQGEQG